MPLISVIMSVYNEDSEWLRKSVESILNQSYKHIEYIIILDDPTNINARNILENYSQQDSRIKLIINPKNLGLVKSLNKGLEFSTGKFIARMDADDISHKERLEKQLSYLNQNNLDLIGSNVNLFNDSNGVFHTTNKLLTHKYIKKLLAVGPPGIVHPTFFARREVYDTLNGYKLCLHSEDQEFLARVFANGFKVGNCPKVLLQYRVHPKSITKSNALYTYKMSKYANSVFIKYLRTGVYRYNEEHFTKLQVSDKELESFNKQQVLMGKIREDINNKRLLPSVFNLARAMYYSPSTLNTIKNNMFSKYYKLHETLTNK